ncbi:uncharacterized protein LOC135462473 [Liolophura sinensis]|uniref:uncharacterized protein LOC135462473 n=1 Tax=Liolophura sinensis TaxID=3198878 RepID=UPI003159284B
MEVTWNIDGVERRQQEITEHLPQMSTLIDTDVKRESTSAQEAQIDVTDVPISDKDTRDEAIDEQSLSVKQPLSESENLRVTEIDTLSGDEPFDESSDALEPLPSIDHVECHLPGIGVFGSREAMTRRHQGEEPACPDTAVQESVHVTDEVVIRSESKGDSTLGEASWEEDSTKSTELNMSRAEGSESHTHFLHEEVTTGNESFEVKAVQENITSVEKPAVDQSSLHGLFQETFDYPSAAESVEQEQMFSEEPDSVECVQDVVEQNTLATVDEQLTAGQTEEFAVVDSPSDQMLPTEQHQEPQGLSSIDHVETHLPGLFFSSCEVRQKQSKSSVETSSSTDKSEILNPPDVDLTEIQITSDRGTTDHEIMHSTAAEIVVECDQSKTATKKEDELLNEPFVEMGEFAEAQITATRENTVQRDKNTDEIVPLDNTTSCATGEDTSEDLREVLGSQSEIVTETHRDEDRCLGTSEAQHLMGTNLDHNLPSIDHIETHLDKDIKLAVTGKAGGIQITAQDDLSPTRGTVVQNTCLMLASEQGPSIAPLSDSIGIKVSQGTVEHAIDGDQADKLGATAMPESATFDIQELERQLLLATQWRTLGRIDEEAVHSTSTSTSGEPETPDVESKDDSSLYHEVEKALAELCSEEQALAYSISPYAEGLEIAENLSSLDSSSTPAQETEIVFVDENPCVQSNIRVESKPIAPYSDSSEDESTDMASVVSVTGLNDDEEDFREESVTQLDEQGIEVEKSYSDHTSEISLSDSDDSNAYNGSEVKQDAVASASEGEAEITPITEVLETPVIPEEREEEEVNDVPSHSEQSMMSSDDTSEKSAPYFIEELHTSEESLPSIEFDCFDGDEDRFQDVAAEELAEVRNTGVDNRRHEGPDAEISDDTEKLEGRGSGSPESEQIGVTSIETESLPTEAQPSTDNVKDTADLSASAAQPMLIPDSYVTEGQPGLDKNEMLNVDPDGSVKEPKHSTEMAGSLTMELTNTDMTGQETVSDIQTKVLLSNASEAYSAQLPQIIDAERTSEVPASTEIEAQPSDALRRTGEGEKEQSGVNVSVLETERSFEGDIPKTESTPTWETSEELGKQSEPVTDQIEDTGTSVGSKVVGQQVGESPQCDAAALSGNSDTDASLSDTDSSVDFSYESGADDELEVTPEVSMIKFQSEQEHGGVENVGVFSEESNRLHLSTDLPEDSLQLQAEEALDERKDSIKDARPVLSVSTDDTAPDWFEVTPEERTKTETNVIDSGIDVLVSQQQTWKEKPKNQASKQKQETQEVVDEPEEDTAPQMFDVESERASSLERDSMSQVDMEITEASLNSIQNAVANQGLNKGTNFQSEQNLGNEICAEKSLSQGIQKTLHTNQDVLICEEHEPNAKAGIGLEIIEDTRHEAAETPEPAYSSETDDGFVHMPPESPQQFASELRSVTRTVSNSPLDSSTADLSYGYIFGDMSGVLSSQTTECVDEDMSTPHISTPIKAGDLDATFGSSEYERISVSQDMTVSMEGITETVEGLSTELKHQISKDFEKPEELKIVSEAINEADKKPELYSRTLAAPLPGIDEAVVESTPVRKLANEKRENSEDVQEQFHYEYEYTGVEQTDLSIQEGNEDTQRVPGVYTTTQSATLSGIQDTAVPPISVRNLADSFEILKEESFSVTSETEWSEKEKNRVSSIPGVYTRSLSAALSSSTECVEPSTPVRKLAASPDTMEWERPTGEITDTKSDELQARRSVLYTEVGESSTTVCKLADSSENSQNSGASKEVSTKEQEAHVPHIPELYTRSLSAALSSSSEVVEPSTPVRKLAESSDPTLDAAEMETSELRSGQDATTKGTFIPELYTRSLSAALSSSTEVVEPSTPVRQLAADTSMAWGGETFAEIMGDSAAIEERETHATLPDHDSMLPSPLSVADGVYLSSSMEERKSNDTETEFTSDGQEVEVTDVSGGPEVEVKPIPDDQSNLTPSGVSEVRQGILSPALSDTQEILQQTTSVKEVAVESGLHDQWTLLDVERSPERPTGEITDTKSDELQARRSVLYTEVGESSTTVCKLADSSENSQNSGASKEVSTKEQEAHVPHIPELYTRSLSAALSSSSEVVEPSTPVRKLAESSDPTLDAAEMETSELRSGQDATTKGTFIPELYTRSLSAALSSSTEVVEPSTPVRQLAADTSMAWGGETFAEIMGDSAAIEERETHATLPDHDSMLPSPLSVADGVYLSSSMEERKSNDTETEFTSDGQEVEVTDVSGGPEVEVKPIPDDQSNLTPSGVSEVRQGILSPALSDTQEILQQTTSVKEVAVESGLHDQWTLLDVERSPERGMQNSLKTHEATSDDLASSDANASLREWTVIEKEDTVEHHIITSARAGARKPDSFNVSSEAVQRPNLDHRNIQAEGICAHKSEVSYKKSSQTEPVLSEKASHLSCEMKDTSSFKVSQAENVERSFKRKAKVRTKVKTFQTASSDVTFEPFKNDIPFPQGDDSGDEFSLFKLVGTGDSVVNKPVPREETGSTQKRKKKTKKKKKPDEDDAREPQLPVVGVEVCSERSAPTSASDSSPGEVEPTFGRFSPLIDNEDTMQTPKDSDVESVTRTKGSIVSESQSEAESTYIDTSYTKVISFPKKKKHKDVPGTPPVIVQTPVGLEPSTSPAYFDLPAFGSAGLEWGYADIMETSPGAIADLSSEKPSELEKKERKSRLTELSTKKKEKSKSSESTSKSSTDFLTLPGEEHLVPGQSRSRSSDSSRTERRRVQDSVSPSRLRTAEIPERILQEIENEQREREERLSQTREIYRSSSFDPTPGSRKQVSPGPEGEVWTSGQSSKKRRQRKSRSSSVPSAARKRKPRNKNKK